MRQHTAVGYCDWFKTWDGMPIDAEINLSKDEHDPTMVRCETTTFDRYSDERPMASHSEITYVRHTSFGRSIDMPFKYQA